MIVKLLTDYHLEFLSLTGCCRGSTESTLVKMPHCWKSHVMAHICEPVHEMFVIIVFTGNEVSDEPARTCSHQNLAIWNEYLVFKHKYKYNLKLI